MDFHSEMVFPFLLGLAKLSLDKVNALNNVALIQSIFKVNCTIYASSLVDTETLS